MNNILESVFKELIKKNIIITEAEEEVVSSDTQTTGQRTSLRLPKFKISEKNWGTKVSTEDRSFVELLGSKLPGETPLERVTGAQRFLDSKDELQENITVGEVMANLMFLDIFSSIVTDFNAAVAGFLFEALFAGIFQGEQIAATEGGGEAGTTDIVIKTKFGQQDYSLKLLTAGGADIKGSAKDILDGIAASPSKKEVYLVGLKSGSEQSLTIDFYEFDVGLDNWFDWIGRPKFKDKMVPVKFKFEGPGQSTAEEPFKAIIDKILSKSNILGQTVSGDFDDKMQFIPNNKGGGTQAARVKKDLRKNYGIKHVVSGQLEETDYLVVGQEYQITVAHPTEKDVSFTDSATEGAFMKLYGSAIKNNPKQLGDQSFLDYIQSKDYLNDPNKFFEILRDIDVFKTGGQFVIPQPYMKAMASRDTKNVRGPATITLDRQKFLRAADNYAEKVGQQIYDLYTNLANLIDDVSGYFLGGTVQERNSFGNKARSEAKVVFETAEKHLVELQEDDTEKAKRDSETQRKSQSAPLSKSTTPNKPGQTGMAHFGGAKALEEMNLKAFSASLLENIIKK